MWPLLPWTMVQCSSSLTTTNREWRMTSLHHGARPRPRCRSGRVTATLWRADDARDARAAFRPPAPWRSPAGDFEYRFLDFRLGEIAHRLKLKMRDVGQFVGRNHAIDY